MPAKRDVLDRIVEKVRISPHECWEYQGERNVFGYGRVKLNGRMVVVHRVTYEHFVGPAPVGLQLDHLCHNAACCNPDHLEPVTPQENVRRARLRVSTCSNGHPYDQPIGTRRRCAICRSESRRARQQRYIARQREAARP